MKKTPPPFFLRFFRWYCHPALRDSIEGDLQELYNERLKESGKRNADINFMIDVVLLFRPGIIRPKTKVYHINQYSMFKNYLKVGIRNVFKYKVFSFINVFGLAVAMSICMLIILMLADRHRYDKFHSNKDRIYRILSFAEGNKQPYATSPNPLAAALASEYSIVEETTNMIPEVGGDGVYQQRTALIRGYFTDPAFFRVLDFELAEGDKRTALTLPNSIVITQALALQLFGQESPIGKNIEFNDRRLSFPVEHDGVGASPNAWGNFQVTGVIDERKYLSHLRFDALISKATLPSLYAEKKLDSTDTKWDWYFRTYTYALLAPDKKEEDLKAALQNLVSHKYAGITSEQVKGFTLLPQALGDIQLGLAGNDTDVRMPLIGYYFLIILASIIMLTACLNYTNLSIARALTRAKEIGVRKVTGAGKGSLVFQFLSESIITTLLSLLMAVVFLYFLKEAFKGLWVNQYLNFELPSSPAVYLIFVGFALLIGLVAGIYPAFHLSKYQPIQALKNLKNLRPGKLGLRKVLGISQFVISLFFITTSLLVLKQFKHFMEFDYGFTSHNIINVELQGQSYKTLANEFSSMKDVSTISASDIIPATGRNNGMEIRKPNGKDEYVGSSIIMADDHFIENLELKIIAGRNLPPAGEGADRYILINEEAAYQLGYAQAAGIIGQTFETKWDTQPLEVIGVVEDFRYQLLINRHEIGPLVLRNQPDQFQYLQVKIASGKLRDIVGEMDTKWKKLDAIHPFKYDFFDEQLASTHKGIFDLVSILGFIAFLAIVISCLGLLGMAIYTAERKTKEVGIRKVMGAENWNIIWLLSLEFIKLLGLSILIGAPLSYFINQAWLQYFPNRVEFGFGIVMLGSIILLLLGLLTIGSQTFRVAKNNPVEALKNE